MGFPWCVQVYAASRGRGDHRGWDWTAYVPDVLPHAVYDGGGWSYECTC